MDGFTMEIAGRAIGVEPIFASTVEYCRPYLTQKEPEYKIQICHRDLTWQQELLDREAEQENLKKRVFKDPFLERSAIQCYAAEWLLGYDILMLHGSTVAVDGSAYLFTAPCGTGKSTHTRLWRELLGQRAVMVNDDKPFLQLTDSGALAYGSPWSGKHGLATNICVPLRGICALSRGGENRISPAAPHEIIQLLLYQAYAPQDPRLQEKSKELAHRLSQLVPLWQLQCNKAPEAAQVSYEAMSAGAASI